MLSVFFPKRGANQLVATLAAASVLDRILRSANSLTLDSGLHTLWQAARCTSKLRGANDIMVASPRSGIEVEPELDDEELQG